MTNLEYAAAKVRELTDEDIKDLIFKLATSDFSGVSTALKKIGFDCGEQSCRRLMCASCFKFWLDEEREDIENERI